MQTSQLPNHWPVDSDWTNILGRSMRSESFASLQAFVDRARTTEDVYPAADDVFNAFRLCSYSESKVVILGQDPYHGHGQAHGLSFSVQGDQRLPPSLKNIFEELKSDVGCDNTTGDLTGWAQQGILLLNTVLTVEAGKPHSHKNQGWEAFTDSVIETIGKRKKPVVFVMWGNHAAKKTALVQEQHFIIKSAHPSPLSAYRGFLGSRPFSATNSALGQIGEQPIDWQL